MIKCTLRAFSENSESSRRDGEIAFVSTLIHGGLGTDARFFDSETLQTSYLHDITFENIDSGVLMISGVSLFRDQSDIFRTEDVVWILEEAA